MKQLFYLTFLLACISCKKQEDQKSVLPEDEMSELSLESTSDAEVILQDFTYEDVAKYTIAAIMSYKNY